MADYPSAWRVIANYVGGDDVVYQACRQTRALQPGEPVHSGVLEIRGLFHDRDDADQFVAVMNDPVSERIEALRDKAAILNIEICALADEFIDQTSGPLQCRLDDARIHSCWLHRDLREARDVAARVGTGGKQ